MRPGEVTVCRASQGKYRAELLHGAPAACEAWNLDFGTAGRCVSSGLMPDSQNRSDR